MNFKKLAKVTSGVLQTVPVYQELNVPSDVTFRLRTRSILLATRTIGRSDPKSCLSLRMASSALSNVSTSSTENTKMKASKKLSPTSCIGKKIQTLRFFSYELRHILTQFEIFASNLIRLFWCNKY